MALDTPVILLVNVPICASFRLMRLSFLILFFGATLGSEL
ncbi:Uncharacterised protein [Segatella copri]|nr:Uncharacterised protein [Segatella copri]